MRRKNRVVGLAAAIAVLCLTACGEQGDAQGASVENAGIEEEDSGSHSQESAEDKETAKQEESSGTEETSEAETSQTESTDIQIERFKTTASIEETVMVDENDIKITATELSYTNHSVELNLLIENNSDKNLSFISGSMGYDCNAVNGYMIEDGYLNADVAAGKKSNEVIKFDIDTLGIYGITEIADIQIGFDVQDEDYEDFYSGVRQIRTSAADSYDYEGESYHKSINSGIWESAYNCTVDYYAEEELYNQNDVKITSQALMTNKDGKKVILIEVRNDSQEMICGVISDIVVNGLVVCGGRWSGDFINPGARRIVSLSVASMLDQSYWDAYGISEIQEFVFSFGVEDTDHEEIAGAEELKITMSDEAAEIDDSGVELYNSNGIRIISKGLFEDPREYSDDIHLMLLAENQSSETVYIRNVHDSFSINGFMADGYFYGAEAFSGKYVVIDIRINSSSLEENKIDGMEDISDIEMTVEMNDQHYGTIDKPVLAISF